MRRGEWAAGLGREGDASYSKFEAGGGSGSWVRRPSRQPLPTPSHPRPPVRNRGSQRARGESPLGPPSLPRGARVSAWRPCLVAAHSLGFLLWPGTRACSCGWSWWVLGLGKEARGQRAQLHRERAAAGCISSGRLRSTPIRSGLTCL